MNEVLTRLTTIIERYYDGNRSEFARAMGKKPDAITSYFQKDSKPGSDFLTEIFKLGFSSDWLLTGEGEMYADNEAGRAFTAPKAAYPDWARIGSSTEQRMAKIIELLGGMQQAETILRTPADELEEALQDDDPSFDVVRECSVVGFSIDWIMMTMNPYYNNTPEGEALRRAVETGTTGEWAKALYSKALAEQDRVRVPRTIGGRMALVRILLSDYFGVSDSAQSFAQFLTEHPNNTAKRVFTAEEIEQWEEGAIQPPDDAKMLVTHSGIDLYWLLLGEEGKSFFQGTEKGLQLAAWYAKRSKKKALEKS